MAEENQEPVNLGDLGTASSSDIRKALEGQPSPVEAKDAVDSETPTETPDAQPASPGQDITGFLTSSSNNIVQKENGSFKFINPYDNNLDVDLDQFETQRRRVSEGSALSGILNGVEGLEESFTYTSLEDTAKRSQEAQGVINKMKNGMTQLVADTGINVAQGFGALLYGVPSAIANGDITKLYDNSLANNLDKGTEFLDEFYKIKRGGDQSKGQKVANFLFDDLAGGASFVMGAIATEMAFSALTAATFGGAAPAQAAVTAGLVARGTRLAQKTLQGGKALISGNLVDDALRASRSLGATATREGAASALQAAAQTARTPMALQAAARVGRQLITGASMESGMEARHMLNASVENQKQQYEELNGKGSFSEEMAEDFREEISGYADGVFGANMALVGASNMLMFPKLFGVGLRKGMSTSKFIDTSKLSQKARARLAKNLGVVEGKLPRLVDAARGNTLGRIAGRTGTVGRVTAANTKNALYEGFIEEGGQGAISRSTEDYISKRYDPKGVKDTVRFADSFLEGLKGSYTTKDGFKEIGIGMLLAFTGVPMYARNQSTTPSSNSETAGKPEKKWKWQMMGGYADQRKALIAQDKKMDAIMNLSEKHGDVGGILRAEIANMNRQNVLQKEQDASIQEGRFKEAKDAEAEMIFSHAATKVVTGRYEQSIAEAQQIMDEMSDEELREQLGPSAKNMTEEDLRAHRNKAMETYRSRMDRARQAYDRAGTVYRGEDADIHTGVAHMLYMTKEKDAREKSIAGEIADAIENMNEGEVLDLVRMQADLNMTESTTNSFLDLINKYQNIDKQLNTKLERKIIKNIDPEKAEQRQKDIASAEQAREILAEEMETMLETMATAQNVERGKYDFDLSTFDRLGDLHRAIRRQQGVEFQEADLKALFEDMYAVAQDRLNLIGNYNDFIKPGGVERFESKMIGSIERLAEMSPEQRQEARQQAAAEEDADADSAVAEEIVKAEEVATKQASRPQDPGLGTSNPPQAQDGGGEFSVNQAPQQVVTEPGIGFPEPAGYTGDVPTAPANMGLGEEPGETLPGEKPTRNTVVSDVTTVQFQFTNANNSTQENKGSTINDKYLAGLKKVIAGLPIGTVIEAREGESNGRIALRADKTLLADIKIQEFSQEVQAELRLGKTVSLVTTSEVSRGFAGGETLWENNNGVRVSANQKNDFPTEDLVREVLPNGVEDIKGMNLVPSNSNNLLPIAGVESMGIPSEMVTDPKFAGNLLVSTVDALTKEEAYHFVELMPMTYESSTQLVDLVDAFNQFVLSPNSMSPSQNELLRKFAEASQIDLQQPADEVSKAVALKLRRIIQGAEFLSEQTKKLKNNPRIKRPLLAVEPLGSGRDGITLVALLQGDTYYSHDKEGNRQGPASEAIAGFIANRPANVTQEGTTVYPDGKGNFDVFSTLEMVQKQGRFVYRAPFVVDGKIYNRQFAEVELSMNPLVPVPTKLKRFEEAPEPAINRSSEFVFERNTQFDPGKFDPNKFGLDADYLPSSSQESTDPMERAGALYEVPGLTSRQLRDGINFSTGMMARAFSTHIRTKDRSVPISSDYLRRYVKANLENNLAYYKSLKQEGFTVKVVEAHEAYLSSENFNPLMDLAMVELLQQAKDTVVGQGDLNKALENIRDRAANSEMLDDAEQAERDANPMAAFDENFAFGVNPKSTLRLESKLLLMGLVDERGTTGKSFGLAGRKFLNNTDLLDKLSAVLAGVAPSYIKVKERLKKYTKTYPQFQSVLDIMTDTYAINSIPPGLKATSTAKEYAEIQNRALSVQDMIRNQFVVFANKEVTTYDSVKIVDVTATQARDIQIWNSNSRNMREHAGNDIRSALIEQEFFDLDGAINKPKFKNLYDQIVGISELPESDQAAKFSLILEDELNISVTPDALTSKNLTDNEKGDRIFLGVEDALRKGEAGTAGIVGRFKTALKDLSTSDLTLEEALSSGSQAGRAVKDFFVGLADYRENFIQKSSKDGDNKTRYQYSAPKLVHQMLREIKTAAVENPASVLLGKRFAQLSAENRRLIELTYLSGIKKGNKGKERNFHGMQVGDNVLAQLAFYGNRNTYKQRDANGEAIIISKFLMPTLADKQTMPILQAPALSAKQAGVVLNEEVSEKSWKTLTFKDVVPNVAGAYETILKDSVDLEIDRIMRIQAGNTEGMTAAQRVAVGFVMVPSLNGVAETFMEGKIKRADFRAEIHSKAVRVFEEAMNEDMQHMLRETEGTIWNPTDKEGVETIGELFHFNGSKKKSPVKVHVAPTANLQKGGRHIVAFVAFLAKYAMDSMNVRTSVIMDTMGDPGAFVKTDKETGKIKPAKTATNLGKRFASLIAPGAAIPYVTYNNRKGIPVDSQKVNFLVIPARVVSKAGHYEYLKKIGQSADELSMQENYDSADAAEYTTVEEHLGILYAKGEITRLEMDDVLSKIANNIKLTNELDWFQPMKPVTTARVGDHMLYVKSAAFPLVPQLTQGTELDKLRVFMETNNVQRAAYDSAVKLGNEWSDVNDTLATEAQKMIPVHVGDTVEINVDELKKRVITGVDRKYMRIQQEVPSSTTNEKVHGSQVAKLLLVDIISSKFILNGESVKGAKMYLAYLKARREEQNARLEVFAARYGMEYDSDTGISHTPESRKKFAERITEEGVDRSYDANELAHLYFDQETVRFLTPLEAGPSSERIENLVKSIIFKEVYEPSIEGFSGPIRPEVGIKSIDEDLVNSGDIMWVVKDGTRLFDGNKLKVAQEGQMDQIIMPWKYKASLEKYMDDDGNINADELPPELLKAFAYRIPNQRKSSSAAFEIVGFLPKSYGDTLIVNEELVGRIGQDYDIDKMFGFLYSIEQTEDGSIEVIRDVKTSRTAEKAQKNKFKKSLYRGQAMKPVIDEAGNLVLNPTREQIAGKNVGISTSTDVGVAIGYGKRFSRTPYIIEIDAEYAAENFVLEDEAVEGEQRIVQKGAVVIPAGKYNVELQNVDALRGQKVNPLINQYINSLGIENGIDEIVPDSSALIGLDYSSTDALLELILDKLKVDYNGLLYYIGEQNRKVREASNGEVQAFEDFGATGLVREADEYYENNKNNPQRTQATQRTSEVSKPASASRRVAIARNEQVDIYLASMDPQDNAVEKAIHAPVTDGYAVALADQMDGLLHDDAVLGLPMSQSYNSRKADAARSAKSSIGVFAKQHVLHAQLQQSLETRGYGGIGFREGEFITILSSPNAKKPTENIALGDIGIHDADFKLEYKNPPVAGNRSDQFSRLLNHSVDNENNGLLSKLGITQDTWPVWTGLTHMGYNQETIAFLVAMPAVQQYLALKKKTGRLASTGSTIKISTLIAQEVTKLQGDSKDSIDIRTLPELDKESMLDIIKGASEKSEREISQMNLRALLAVEKLEVMGRDLSRVQNFMGLDTNRPKTLIGLQVALSKMETPPKSDREGTTFSVLDAVSAAGMTVSGQISNLVKRTATGLLNIQNNLLPQNIISSLVADFERAGLTQSVEESIGDLIKGVKSYNYSLFTAKLAGRSAEEVRAEAHNLETGGIATLLIEARQNPEIANNSFIKQLIAVKAPGSYPHLEFPGDRELEGSSTELHRGFLSLLRSADPEVKKFGEYLVVYALATSGGKLKARGYLKYVPAEYLQSKGLGDIVNIPNIAENVSTDKVITEVIRHNDTLAPYYNSKADAGIFTSNEVLHLILRDGNNKVGAASFRGHVRVKNALYAPSDTMGRMVRHKGQDVEAIPLKLVSKLGDYLTDEYTSDFQPANKKPIVKSLKGNTTAPAPDAPPQGTIDQSYEPNLKVAEEYDPNFNPVVPMNVGLSGEVNDEIVRSENPNKMPMGIKEFLKVSELRNNPFIQELAQTQESLQPEDRVTVVVSEDLPEKGMYDPNINTVTIRQDMVNDIHTVTHELVHAFTSLSIKVAQGKAKISDPKKKAKMVDAVNELQKLLNIARTPESLQKMGLTFAGQQQSARGYRAFKNQRDGKTLTAEEQLDLDFFKENLDKYYAFVSLEEFVAESFSNKEFAERIAKLSLNRNETFIDRFMQAVNKALIALGINFGKDTNFLKEVYTLSMGIVDIQTGGQIGLIPGQQIASSDLIDAVTAVDVGGQNLQGLDQMKDYKEKRIRQFEELKSRYNTNREFVRRVEARLVQERKDLKLLTDDSVEITPDYFLAVGQRELDFARRTIENVDSTDPQITMALSALENIYSVVEFYDKSREILKDPALLDVATALRREASELKDNYLDKARDITRRGARQELEKLGVNVDANSFETLQQVGWMKSYFMDASRQGTVELSFLDKIVRDASQLQRVQFNARAKRYMENSKKFKETSYFKEHGWNGMVELDAQGNPTANMLTMLSGSYESEYNLKRATLNNSKAFYDWKRSVTGRIDISAMFDISGTEVKRKNNPKYVEYLNKTYGAAGAAEFLQQQETMAQEYVDARTSEFDTLELTLGENATDAKALWEAKNNPIQAYKRAEGKGGRFIKGATSRFLLDIPLRTVKGKATNYYDARFDQLQSEPDALAFYNDYRQQIKEMMAMLPAHKMTREAHLVRNGLFIPAIAKSLTNDLFKAGGLATMMKQLPDNIRSAFTIDPEYNINKLIDPVTGRPRQELPTYFLGQVDPETQDYDMDRTFLAFTMMATTYDSKNAIEDKVRMTKSVMSNARVGRVKKGLAESVLNKLGVESAVGYADEAARATTMRVVNTVVDTFYGYQSNQDITFEANEILFTKKQKEKLDELKDQKLAAKTQEEKDLIQSQIEEATPQVSVYKGIRGVQQFIQAKGMAWNVPAAIVNIAFGAISVFKHASGQRDFTEADTRKATGIMLSSSLNNMTLNTGLTQNKQALKTQNAMISFDSLKDFTEMRHDQRKFKTQSGETSINQAESQGFNKLRMYEIQRSSEYFVYGQVMISVLLHEKVEGKSLWEHMGGDGIIDIDGYRPGEEKHLALMNKMDQINKRIHGNYDPSSPIAVKKIMIGPLLMQFRSWLPESVAARFEKEKFDPYLQRDVKGTYQTMFFSSAIRKHLTAMLPMLVPSWARTKGMNEMSAEISAVDQENIRKFAASLRQYLQIMILISVLRALKDDEDDKEALMILNAGLNVADRVENDLALFGRPGAFLDMTQGDFAAAIGAASDVEKLGEAVVKTAQGDGMIETGVYAGKSRMWHHFQKLVPHLGAVQRIANNLDRELGS